MLYYLVMVFIVFNYKCLMWRNLIPCRNISFNCCSGSKFGFMAVSRFNIYITLTILMSLTQKFMEIQFFDFYHGKQENRSNFKSTHKNWQGTVETGPPTFWAALKKSLILSHQDCIFESYETDIFRYPRIDDVRCVMSRANNMFRTTNSYSEGIGS